jgi:hypothetical protein
MERRPRRLMRRLFGNHPPAVGKLLQAHAIFEHGRVARPKRRRPAAPSRLRST